MALGGRLSIMKKRKGEIGSGMGCLVVIIAIVAMFAAVYAFGIIWEAMITAIFSNPIVLVVVIVAIIYSIHHYTK